MAQNGISINVLADVRDAVRGADNVADAMEQVADVLKDIADEGGDTTDRMERDFRDLSRTADRESDQLRDKFRQAYRDVKRSSDDTKDVAIKNTRKMGEQAGEVGQEIRQNLGEGIANAARGDFESLADTIGDTFGGAVAGIGGIGSAAVAAAGALGLGAIVATIGAISEESTKLKEQVAENFRDMASEGVEAWESTQSQMQRLTDAYADHEDEIKRIAELTGLSFEVVAGAWAGVPDKVDTVNRAYGDMVSELENTFGVTREGVDATVDGWERVMRPLTNVQEGYDKARQKARLLEDAQSRMWLRTIDDAKTATFQTDKFNNKLVSLPSGEQVVIEAETGRATTNLNRFKGDVNKLPKKRALRVEGTVDLSSVTQGIRNYRPPSIVVPAQVTISNKYGSRQRG